MAGSRERVDDHTIAGIEFYDSMYRRYKATAPGCVHNKRGNLQVQSTEERKGSSICRFRWERGIQSYGWSMSHDSWTIRDGETEAKLAAISSSSATATALQNLVPFGLLVPHRYEMSDRDGNVI